MCTQQYVYTYMCVRVEHVMHVFMYVLNTTLCTLENLKRFIDLNEGMHNLAFSLSGVIDSSSGDT